MYRFIVFSLLGLSVLCLLCGLVGSLSKALAREPQQPIQARATVPQQPI
jgi:hypothetical protein